MTDPDGTAPRDVGEPPGAIEGLTPDPNLESGRIAVLYVDRDPDSRERVADALSAADERVAVRTAADAEAARARLDGVDCVVSEHQPPEVDGLAVLDAVRDRFPDRPFVLFTADGSESLASEVLSADATEYLRRDPPEALTVLADRVVTVVERERSHSALVRHADFLERTQRLTSVGGWEYDIRTGTSRWTDGVRRIHGVDEDYEPDPDSTIELYHPEDRPKLEAAFDRAVEEGEPYELELRIVTPDGDRRWVQTRGERHTENGEPAYLRGSIKDVTDRKRQEQQLRESKETIEALHRAAPEIAAAEDAETVAERTVAAAERLLEFRLCSVLFYDDGYLDPAALSEGAPPDGAERRFVDAEGEGGLAGKTYRTGESFVIDRVPGVEEKDDADDDGGTGEGAGGDGRTDGEADEAVPDEEVDPAREEYRSGISVAIGDHGIFQAVSTEFEAFDDEDLELAELLVAYAASALDRINREEELRRQNERLDQFARVVSHDLRNPMEVIHAEVSLTRETGDLSRLDRVETTLDRMDRIVEDLLTLGRAGQQVGDLAPVELGSVVEETWATVDTGPAELVVEIPDAYRFDADRGRLRQVLANLFRNAIEHGGEDVTVRVGRTEEGFYVEDDGPGIGPDEREAVFDPGFTTDDHGTGLGLAIVKGVVDAHGWRIEATEGSTGGARFEITVGEGSRLGDAPGTNRGSAGDP